VKVGTFIFRLLIGLHEVDLYRDNLGSIIIFLLLLMTFSYVPMLCL